MDKIYLTFLLFPKVRVTISNLFGWPKAFSSKFFFLYILEVPSMYETVKCSESGENTMEMQE